MDPSRWKLVEKLFLEAADRAPAELEPWLAAATDDESLRQEVRDLLAYDDAGGGGGAGSLESSLSEAAARVLEHDTAARWAGRTIGAYRVEREIGRGGMGVVLLAERADGAFERKVAIKLSLAGLASPALAQRLESERQILAALDHPAIARLLDGGTTDEGVPYVVMDFVEGTPIDDHCAEGRLDLRARLELFLEVCEAVEHAHRALVVHRDLKPANILVTAEGRPKLLDFGIAKLLGPEAAGGRDETRTLMRALTPEYASPEQVRGEAVTTASDVYGLGVVLFELLTGERPFRIEAQSAAEFERQLTTEDPPRPSSVPSAADGAARLEGDLDNIVLKALRKEPGRRYPGVREFADDIRRHLEGRPVSARPNTLGYRLQRFVGRHRVAVAAALVALVAAGGALAYHANRLADERDRALLEAEKSARIAEYLEQIFVANDPNESKGKTVTARELLDRATASLDEDLASDPLLRIDLLTTMSRAYRAIAEYDAALETSRRALDIVEREGLEGSARHARLLSAISSTEAAIGNDERASELTRRALGMLEGLPGEDTAAATGIFNIALLELRAGKYEEAARVARQAYERRVRLFGRDDPRSATALAIAARARFKLGELDQARALHEEVLAIRLASLGENHASTSQSLTELATLDELSGDLQGALGRMERALSISRRIFAPDHPKLAMTLVNTAGTLIETGGYRRAEELAREGLAILEERLPAGHPDSARARGILGGALQVQGRYEEAFALQERALADLRERLGPGHPTVVVEAHNLATSQYEMGAFEASLAGFDALMPLWETLLDPRHPNVGFAHAARGKALIELDRIEEAKRELTLAREIVAAALGEEHRVVASHLFHLGRAALAEGALDEARALMDEGLAMRRRVGEGEANLAIADSLHGLGELELAAGRWEAAAARFDEALAMRTALHGGRPHFEIALSAAGLAEAKLRAGAPRDAREHADAALKTAREVSAPPQVLGRVLVAHGLVHGDRSSLEEAATSFASSYPDGHPRRKAVERLIDPGS